MIGVLRARQVTGSGGGLGVITDAVFQVGRE
jgi:hypothetical protein